MSIDKEIYNLLESFGKETVLDLDKSLMAKVSKGGGYNPRLRALIKYQFIAKSGSISMAVTMPEYGLALDGGRSPTESSGTGALRQNLISWIKRKNLKVNISQRKIDKTTSLKNKKVRKSYKEITREKKIEQMAFAISRKIHKFGYKGNNFIKDVITDGRTKELEDKLSEIFKTDVIISINNGINS